MRFTIVYRGRIPASGSVSQITAIREDPYLQSQLTALYKVTGQHLGSSNKQIVGSVEFVAIIPIAWVCQIEIVLLRATPPAQISGMPDLDNTLKTLFDAICAPAGTSQPAGSTTDKRVHVLAIEDKQFSSITVSGDQHWTASADEDMAIIRVTTQETLIDDAVALGGQTFKTLRKNVY